MDNLYRQAQDLKNRALSYFDKPNETPAQRLRKSAEKLLDAIELKKQSRQIEDLVRQIENEVRSMSDDHMDYGHRDDLLDICEQLRKDLRKQ